MCLFLIMYSFSLAEVPSSLISWEGIYKPVKTYELLPKGYPLIRLHEFRNESTKRTGSGSCVILECNDTGKNAISGPSVDGVHPILNNDLVLPLKNQLEIILEFQIQGNGRHNRIDKYKLNDGNIRKVAEVQYEGRYGNNYLNTYSASQLNKHDVMLPV